MAVKVKVKLKELVAATTPVEVETVVLATADVEVLVDEFGAVSATLEKALAKLEPLTKKRAEIRARLDALADENAEPEQRIRIIGAVTEVEYGKKANKVVSKDLIRARKLLKDETFFKLVDVTVGDLEKYLTPPQLAQVLKREASGARTFKVSKAAKVS